MLKIKGKIPTTLCTHANETGHYSDFNALPILCFENHAKKILIGEVIEINKKCKRAVNFKSDGSLVTTLASILIHSTFVFAQSA